MLRKLACVCVLSVVACGQESADQVTGAVVVAHTTTGIVTASTADWENNPFRTEVDQFFPAVCLDFDHDGDGVPDSMDIDQNDDVSQADQVEHQCHRCNRGPGQSGDFRLRVSGDQAELDRGLVMVIDADGSISVPSPDGPILIAVNEATQLDDGLPTPGAEIRAEGTVTATGAFTATRLRVLCPGPAPVDGASLPPGSQPVNPGGTNGDDDGPDHH